MKTSIFSFLFICILHFTCEAQIKFQKTYGFLNQETGMSILSLADGYLVAGTTSGFGAGGKDIFALRLNLSGDTIWCHAYGGPSDEEAYAMQATSDGGFVIAGTTFSYIGPALTDFSNAFLVKIDSAGNQVWSQSINVGSIDAAYCVKQTFDKGFVMTGYTGTFVNGPNDMIIVKTDSLGDIDWVQNLGMATSSIDIGRSVIQTRDSGYAAVGYSTAFTANGDTNIYVVIINPAGNVTFTRHITVTSVGNPVPPISAAYDLIQNSNGNLLVAGAAGGVYSGVVYINQPEILLLDSLGTFITGMQYSLNSGDCRAFSIHQTSDGGYIAGGIMGNYYPVLIKTDFSLNKQWCHFYGNFSPPGIVSNGWGMSAIQTPDGGYAIAGYKNESPGTRIHVVKTDSLGQSGCNQGIPALLGSSSAVSVTTLQGTVFSLTIGNNFSVVTGDTLASLYDTTLCITTQLQEFPENNKLISIFPNPANESFSVKIDANQNEKYFCEILTASGQLLFKTGFITNELLLNSSLLNEGVYFVKIHTASNLVHITKLVIIHNH